jgi:hypothetical protein
MRSTRTGLVATMVVASLLGACAGEITTPTVVPPGADAPIAPGGADARVTTVGPDAAPGSADAPLQATPSISAFAAMPATLPAGGGSATLSWQVSGADHVEIDQGVGAVSGSSKAVFVTATTVFTLTASNASGSTQAWAAVVVGSNPSMDGLRYVHMVAPVSGESFTAPSSLRLVAAAYDPNVFINTPTDGHGGNAAQVQFFVDDAMVYSQDGPQAEYYVFKGFVSGVAAGHRRVWARAIYTNPALVLDSAPVLIDVAAPGTYTQTVDLDGDLTVSGDYNLGGPGGRVRVNGHGHRIVSPSAGSGAIHLENVDFFDVGPSTATATPGIVLATSTSLVVEGCVFDGMNPVDLTVDGTATATIHGNTFRSNLRQPIGQQPDGPDSSPAVTLHGASSAAKTFARNNVGAGWVLFERTHDWVIGGDTDADANVCMGPRVGIFADGSDRLTVRRNYSHHIYYGGWSQGSNLELGSSASVLAERNVIVGSSWPVRGVGGEFRYNLVLLAGHEWLWAVADGAYVHHNVFIGGDNDVGGIFVLYQPKNVRIVNNTLDGLGNDSVTTGLEQQDGAVTLSSNLFLNMPKAAVTTGGGTLSSDYNLFWNTGGPYSDGRHPAHDVVNHDPLLTSPATTVVDYDESQVWLRNLGVGQILAQYRDKYTPKSGSPAIDAGDPAGGAGNDIGAVGAGTANAADQFGR